MRLITYYIPHAFVGALKKLFRTWVAILVVFFLVCALFGGVIGLTVGTMAEKAEEPSSAETQARSMTPEQHEFTMDIVEMVCGGVILLILVWNIFSADNAAAAHSNGKKATALFTMPDVNLLFPSPNPPQTILLFRTILQMGLLLAGSLYLIFQLPNLIINLGMPWQTALCLLLAWALLLMIGKLVNLFFYSVTATKPALKKILLPLSLGIPAAVAAAYLIHFQTTGNAWQSAKTLFASEASRWIPVWGWLKGIVAYSEEGNRLGVLLCTLASVLFIVLMICLIWSIRVDFYEDALQGASDHFQKTEQIKAGKPAAKKHKDADKDRKERRIGAGCGASVLYFKGWFVRKNGAFLGFFKGMTWLYLAIAILIAVLQNVVFRARTPVFLGGVFALILFFAGFGDPIIEDTQRDLLYLMPEAPWKKLMFPLLWSLTDSALTFLPAFLIGGVILRASAWEIIVWSLALVALTLYNSAGGLLVSLLLPSHLTPMISSLVQVMVRMLLILPPIFVIAAGAIFDLLLPAMLLSALLFAASGVIFFLPCPALLKQGKK